MKAFSAGSAIAVGVLIGCGAIILSAVAVHSLDEATPAPEYVDNVAADAFAPIDSELVAMGGEQVCTNGHGGHGPDNTVPWFTAYYSFEDADVLDDLSAMLAENGYEPQPVPEDYQSSDGAAFFIDSANASDLYTVTTESGSTESLRCSVDWGRELEVTGNRAVLQLNLSYPDTNPGND